jgi:hypothetical protein
MARVETQHLACGICGGPADDSGHMVEACPNEPDYALRAREEREKAHKTTRMPIPREGLEHACRVHGENLVRAHKPDSGLELLCCCKGETVARLNTQTNRWEWTNGAAQDDLDGLGVAPLEDFGANAGGTTPREALEKMGLLARECVLGPAEVLKVEVGRAPGGRTSPAWFHAVMWVSRA